MRILIVDNFDSFTFNLLHYVEQFAENVEVIRYNEKIIEQSKAFDALIISPGPGLPKEYPLLSELILKYYKIKPILGICLGLQSIAETFNAKLKNLIEVNHGMSRKTYLTKNIDAIFNHIPICFLSGRYHSWVIDEETLSNEFLITANDNLNSIMAIKHKKFNLKGVQFHPESILTPDGKQVIKNWIESIKL